MSFAYRSKKMAQALAIVGEAGIHGMDYNAVLDKITLRSKARQSVRFRVSLLPAHRFSTKEFEDYMILAWRFGLVHRSSFKEIDWVAGKNKSSYEIEDETVMLTQEGWEFVEANDQPLIHRWFNQIVENIPTIVISIIGAVSVAWALNLIGPTDTASNIYEPVNGGQNAHPTDE